MGKLNIAHHKSYHPYRLDNIERVRRDEEEARLKERGEEDRMRLADSEARLELLRGRSGGKKRVKKDSEEGRGQEAEVVTLNTITTSSGHINLFADIEQRAVSDAMVRSREVAAKGAKADDEKGVRLAPSTKDLNPWYSEYEKQKEAEVAEDKRMRDLTWKMHSDPLTSINSQLARSSSSSTAARPSSSSSSSRRTPHHPSTPTEARLQRETSERARALELIRRKKRERERAALGMANMTPSSIGGGEDLDHRGYDDVYNRKETEEAHRRWDRHGGGGGSSWARSGERGIVPHERRRGDREDRGYRDRRW